MQYVVQAITFFQWAKWMMKMYLGVMNQARMNILTQGTFMYSVRESGGYIFKLVLKLSIPGRFVITASLYGRE